MSMGNYNIGAMCVRTRAIREELIQEPTTYDQAAHRARLLAMAQQGRHPDQEWEPYVRDREWDKQVVTSPSVLRRIRGLDR